MQKELVLNLESGDKVHLVFHGHQLRRLSLSLISADGLSIWVQLKPEEVKAISDLIAEEQLRINALRT